MAFVVNSTHGRHTLAHKIVNKAAGMKEDMGPDGDIVPAIHMLRFVPKYTYLSRDTSSKRSRKRDKPSTTQVKAVIPTMVNTPSVVHEGIFLRGP